MIFSARPPSISYFPPSLRFDGSSGKLLERSGPPGGATLTFGTLEGLHVAHFADPALRLLFFVCGLLGCLMVASGAVLWATKERPKHLKAGRIGFGLRLVDSLNIGAVAGLPVLEAFSVVEAVFGGRVGHGRFRGRAQRHSPPDKRITQPGRRGGALGYDPVDCRSICSGRLLGAAARTGTRLRS